MKTLVPLLGDQLSLDISALQSVEKSNAIVLLCECMDETSYVAHHKKKLVFVLSCMRHFKQRLLDEGWTVVYRQLDDKNCPNSIVDSIQQAIAEHECQQVVMTNAGEYRLQESLAALQSKLDLPMTMLEDTRFLCTGEKFQAWAASRKQLRMENFYRDMRRKTDLLMDGDKPIGDQWNFDKQNRKPAGKSVKFSEPLRFEPDEITHDVITLVDKHFPENMGGTKDFWFACTETDANNALDHFLDYSLAQFGDYQDAMLHDQKFLAHSVLSLYINIGLLDPLKVCERVEIAYKSGQIPINAAEGFIRQIIGWREYVRGIYWLEMPQYLEQNFFDYGKPLPDFYWTADTRMACLKASIQHTIDEGYAHHIQRLMITGNFAMLAGVDPKQVHEWYLAVYVDAYEWVELPNTLGMSQFADGGLLGSKPYAAGGNYVNKMSDYCKNCEYKVSKKTGADACPFNYLYWNFISANKEKLSGNHRMAQVYSTWGRMSAERKSEIHADAKRFLESL